MRPRRRVRLRRLGGLLHGRERDKEVELRGEERRRRRKRREN